MIASIWWLSPVAQAETLRLGLQQALAIGMAAEPVKSVIALQCPSGVSMYALALGSYALLYLQCPNHWRSQR